jgi:hypothetical protein
VRSCVALHGVDATTLGGRHWAVKVRIDQSGDGDVSDPHPDAAGAALVRRTERADADRTGRDAAVPGEAPAPQDVQQATRVEYYARTDTVFRAYAIDQGYARIQEIEETTVTPAMLRIEAGDPSHHLAGLEHRLKGKDRLTEKVTSDVERKGVTVEQALGNVKDAIRYTLCYPEDRYTQGVHADCDRLQAEGFDLVERIQRTVTGKQ